MARSAQRIMLALGVILLLSPVTRAQRARMLEPAEYGRWEQLVAQRTPLSPDGRWLVYGITRANRDNEVRVQPSDGGAVVKAVPFGEQPAFSDDSRWLAYLIGFSEEQEAKLRKDKKPLHKKLGLLELASGRETAVDGIESFSFSPSGSHLAMRRYAPEPANNNGNAGNNAPRRRMKPSRPGPRSSSASWRPGATRPSDPCPRSRGRTRVRSWRSRSPLKAASGTASNSSTPSNGTLRVLDSSASTYTGLSWRKDSAALAALRSQSNDAREGPTHVLLAWPDVTRTPPPRESSMQARVDLRAISRIVRFRAPRWSEDGARIYVGVAPWTVKPVARRRSRAVATRRRSRRAAIPTSSPDVQVWHPKDTDVMAKQKLNARRDRRAKHARRVARRRRPLRSARHRRHRARSRHADQQTRALVVDTGRLTRWNAASAASAADLDGRSRRPEREPKVLSTASSDRQVCRRARAAATCSIFKADHFWTMDTRDARRSTNITKAVATRSSTASRTRRSGRSRRLASPDGRANDGSVLLYDKLDIWEVAAGRHRRDAADDGARR